VQVDDSDGALVRAAQAGDKGAFATLLARHWPLLLALCRRAVDDSLLAEDAAQEAALQALLSLDRLRQPERFGSWLGGIGLNVCRRWLRRRARDDWSWEALCGGQRAPEPPDRHPGPEEQAEAAELRELMRRAVAELPPGQRAAVLLFHLSGLTHAETAALLGVEVGAVKTRLHKARATLRRRLRSVWQEEVVEMATAGDSQAIEVRVADVRRPPAEAGKPRHHVVVLEEIAGTRRLPIWIGPFEGEALAFALEQVQPPRPLAYTLTANLLRAAGGRLREVRVSRLVEDIFYAVAVVEGPGGTESVDARPSDALNLALIAGAPIRVEPAVLETEETAQAADPERSQKMQTVLFGEGWEGAAEIAASLKAKQPGQGAAQPEAR
jgi:RNA polymerase sigma factor (sigma-70 family)